MKTCRLSRFLILALSVFIAFGLAGAPEAQAADDPNQIRFIVGHADCGGIATFEFFVNDVSVGVYPSTQGCVCNTDPLVVTVNDPNILNLIEQVGCTPISMTLTDPSGGNVALGYVRAEIDRTESGTETFCLIDFMTGGSCEDRDVCEGYGYLGTSSYSNTLNCPDTIEITPADGLACSGYEGGPFEPLAKDYLISNADTNSVSWTVAEANDMPWLDVSPSGGTLDPNESTVVSVSIDPNVEALAVGTYGTDLIFANLTSGRNHIRPVNLAVKQMPPDGWASMNGGTTGGASGAVVEVDNAEDFKTYVEATEPYVVEVTRTIDLSAVGGTVSITSNKTIRGKGIGTKPVILGSLLFVSDAANIIIKGLNITNPVGYGDGDGITATERITNLFITKCSIYDCPDGCIDITRECDYITVSWCKFYYTNPSADHRFVNLIGHDDVHTADRGHLRISFHHNWWAENCDQRMPRVRFGQVHVYNNYYSCQGNYYCAGAALESQLLIENNYYDTVNSPYTFFSYSDPNIIWGKINASGNVFVNCFGMDSNDVVFTPPYSYGLDYAADIKDMVMANAGAPVCYGDFDRNEVIDFNDIAKLADYWLKNIVDEDYYIDGMVNVRELALLTRNWRNDDFMAPAAPQNLTATGGDGHILLDWSDNNEPDLAGYNIYRSMTWDNHTKINSSLVTDSNYTDSNVVNATAYFYIIKAIDTSGNDSVSSDMTSGIPLGAGSIIIQENETGYCGFSGFGSVSLIYDGYTGTGFCNTNNMVGNGIIWSIEVPTTGVYTFTWRHANGTTDSPANLLVDDVIEVSAISFPNTGGWENWETVSQDVTLTAGVRTIKLLATTSKGLSSIDYIMVTGDNPQPAACP
ncbi:MAG: carbohydrate-binding protein [Sedimentisphaerales bacterium]|nr:carbohydrate-binding protein [Sedimentisphaerales bacterium]